MFPGTEDILFVQTWKRDITKFKAVCFCKKEKVVTIKKWLKNLYGREYEEYCRRVNRCIPWLLKSGKGICI